jgi:hypothetical protein
VEAAEATSFHITDDVGANWYLRKLANLEAEQRRVQAQAAAIVKQLEADAERLRYLYEAELQEYVRQKLASAGSRRKSVHFLQGAAGFRTVPAAICVTDTLAALDYATLCLLGAVKTQQVLDMARYRKQVEETGELLPRVEVTEAYETFKVTFGKEERGAERRSHREETLLLEFTPGQRDVLDAPLTTFLEDGAGTAGTLAGLDLPDAVPARYPHQQKSPTRTDHFVPEIEARDEKVARAFAAQSVADLRRLLFARYNLA